MPNRCLRIATVVLPMLSLALLARADDGVLTGIDVLVRDGFKPLAGRRIGLITNQTGIARDGRTTIELLRSAPGAQLVALFSPEHGIAGAKDEKIGHSTDPNTGLNIYSLYGETKRPTAEMLAGIDTLVYDIQDIGTRFYTYVATLGYAMEEAAKQNIRVVVLDRPNPITGTRVFGPFNTKDGEFTAYHRMPLVHGMTVGELARLFNAERKIGCDLVVVQMEGWRRSMWWDETGLVWINPSPNMRSVTQAALYPAIGMIEACSLSVGRGTDTPFERFGAPWIDGRRLAASLNQLRLEGVRFVPFRFTPESSKFKGQPCDGVQVILTDRDAFDPALTGLFITATLESLFSDKFDAEHVNNLLFNSELVEGITHNQYRQPFTALWADELAAFMAVRAKHLLYK